MPSKHSNQEDDILPSAAVQITNVTFPPPRLTQAIC